MGVVKISVKQPQSYPAALLKKRHCLPSHLHIFVERSSVHNIHSSDEFNYDALNKSSIEAHLQRNVASGFISLYESADTASRKYIYSEDLGSNSRSCEAVKVEVDTTGMTPAWISTENGVIIPVWVAKGIQRSQSAHNGEVLWLCLEEVRVVLSIEDNLGEKGEWLACGSIPQARAFIYSGLSKLEPQRNAFNDEERYETDRQARHERLRKENERLRLDQLGFEHRVRKTQSSRSIKPPPEIPQRMSSLSPPACTTIGEPGKKASKSSKFSLTTRTARLSLTNADPQSALSLMKYAVLMAHGNKMVGEGNWLPETTPSIGGLDGAGSMRTIESGSHMKRRNGFAGRDIEACLTPPESPKGPFKRQHTHEQRGNGGDEEAKLGYEPAQHDSHKSSHDERRREHRSAAPSPSHSMLDFHTEGFNRPSLRPQRSRRDLLLELQSDQDSVLREYARISLQDPGSLNRTRNGHSKEDAASRIHHQDDSESLISLRNRLAASRSFSRSVVPAHDAPPVHDIHDEAHEVAPVKEAAQSLYSTMSSLSSLSTFPNATIGNATIENAVYASVELASNIKQIDIPSKKSQAGSASASSGRTSNIQSTNVARASETQARVEAEAEAEATVPRITILKAISPHQAAHEAQALPKMNPTPTHFAPPPTQTPATTPAPAPAPAPAPPSKSEAFLARAKCLGEKGKELTGRLAEMRERQKPAKGKREKWELGMWESSGREKKKE